MARPLFIQWPGLFSGKNTAPSVFSEGIGKDAVLSLSFCVFAGTYSTFQPLECTFHDAGIYIPRCWNIRSTMLEHRISPCEDRKSPECLYEITGLCG